MPRKCSVCAHPERDTIDKAILAEGILRALARQYGLSRDALERHKKDHIAAALAKTAAAQALTNAEGLAAEIQRLMVRINLLYDACHRWLQDPNNPEQYDLGPRAEEVRVIYLDRVGNQVVRRKAKLSELLPKIEQDGRVVEAVEVKRADPRELILKTSQRLEGQLELLAKLLGELQEGPTINNILVMPQWQTLRSVILGALQAHPQAKLSVVEALLERTTPNGLSN
jgi:hypothetical protein